MKLSRSILRLVVWLAVGVGFVYTTPDQLNELVHRISEKVRAMSGDATK